MMPCLCLERQCTAAGPWSGLGVVACSWLVLAYFVLHPLRWWYWHSGWSPSPSGIGISSSLPLWLRLPSQCNWVAYLRLQLLWLSQLLVWCCPQIAAQYQLSWLKDLSLASSWRCRIFWWTMSSWLIDWSPLVLSQVQWFTSGWVRCHPPWPGFIASWPMQQFVARTRSPGICWPMRG